MESREPHVLVAQEQIRDRVAKIGEEITRDYQGKELLVVGILKGAFIFMADLVRELKLPIKVDFIAVSSYGSSTESSGIVRFNKDLEESIEGRHVLLVEDIMDTGLTLHYIVQNLSTRNPASLKICTFLDKPARRKTSIKANYVGFMVPDEFIIGYGLDYDGKYRHIPQVTVLDRSEYS